jgi:hypothetical protein
MITPKKTPPPLLRSVGCRNRHRAPFENLGHSPLAGHDGFLCVMEPLFGDVLCLEETSLIVSLTAIMEDVIEVAVIKLDQDSRCGP